MAFHPVEPIRDTPPPPDVAPSDLPDCEAFHV